MSFKEILPSKQFGIRVGILCGIILLVIGMRYLSLRAKNKPIEDAISAFLGRPTTPETIGTDFLQAFWLQETGELPSEGIKPRDPSILRDSATGTLTRELFPIIALVQQTGGMTPDIQEEFMQTLENYVTSDRFDVFYEVGFFKSVQTNKENTLIYLNEFEKIFTTLNTIPDPLPIIEQAVSSHENQDLLPKIRPILLSYQNLEKKLLSMNVPTEALYHHMNFTNAITGTRSNLENLVRINDDPILALAGVTRYQNDFSNIRESLRGLLEYFIQPKITEYNLE
jgi:hypothetical protein